MVQKKKIKNFSVSVPCKVQCQFRAFTLVEVLIGTFLILIIFLGIFGAFRLGLKVTQQSRARIVATALANHQLEKVRALPYASVGVIGGFPEGVLESSTTTISNNIEYKIETRVDFVVDAADGLVPPDDECPNDYKRVQAKVSWPGMFGGEVKLVTDIAPENLAQECATGGGILSVSVFDAYGIMVASPLIEVINPETEETVKTATPSTGQHYFSLPAASYRVVVSKEGYSTERTYNSDEIATPEKPNPIVLEGQLTEISFSIDKVSTFLVTTMTPPTPYKIYYVRKTGNDSNDGLSPETAFLSIQKAASVMESGDMVYVGAGIYNEEITPQNSGSAARDISFVADTDGSETGDPGDVIVQGLTYGFYIYNKSYITIYGFKITGATSDGIYVDNQSNNVKLIKNTIYSNGRHGIHIYYSDYAYLGHNDIYQNSQKGIFLNNRSNYSTITQNTVFSNGQEGINLYYSSNAKITWNNSYSNNGYGIFLDNRSDNNTLKNNSFYLNQADGIRLYYSSSNTLSHNSSYSNTGTGIFLDNTCNENSLTNDLLYDNALDGIYLYNSQNNVLGNNTIYRNYRDGIFLDNGSNDSTVRDNIIAQNSRYGIQVYPTVTFTISYNDLWQNGTDYYMEEPWGPLLPGEGDISLDPLFFDPDGPDNTLGNANGTDDSFHLSQIEAGQATTSPCVDGGSNSALNLRLDTKTTRTDEITDTGTVDMGYHYTITSPPEEPSEPSPPSGGYIIANATFHLQGAKIIGRDVEENPVYKYSKDHTTDSNGQIAILNLEWDSYTFSVDPATGLDLVDTDPSPQPINLPPDTRLSVNLYLEAENSLLVIVKNQDTLEPIFSATVRLSNTGLGYDVTQYTNEKGETYFIPLDSATYNLEIQALGYLDFGETLSISGDVTEIVALEQVE
jgi:parallel beta-helix repeat protein